MEPSSKEREGRGVINKDDLLCILFLLFFFKFSPAKYTLKNFKGSNIRINTELPAFFRFYIHPPSLWKKAMLRIHLIRFESFNIKMYLSFH